MFTAQEVTVRRGKHNNNRGVWHESLKAMMKRFDKWGYIKRIKTKQVNYNCL